MKSRIVPAALAASFAAVLSAGAAHAESQVKVGTLECSVTETDKTLLKTHVVLGCSFLGSSGTKLGSYRGTVDRTGLNVGGIETKSFTWTVLTVGDAKNVKLDGSYVGASAGVSGGTGVGVNYLVGGFNQKISLQPYSVEGEKGLGLSLSGQQLVLQSM